MCTLLIVVVTESVAFAFARNILDGSVTLEIYHIFVDLNDNNLNINDQCFVECLNVRSDER